MPKYSTGCRACVTRRVRCDETGTPCRNCQDKNLSCDGPCGGLRIIFHTAQPSKPSIEFGSKIKKKIRLDTHGTRRDWSAVANSLSSDVTTRYDRKTQFCHLRRYWGDTIGSSATDDSIWMDHVALHPSEYPAASQALESLTTAYFGRKHHEPRLISRAGQLYGRALASLRQSLQQRAVHNQPFDAVAAMSALRRYECVMCTNSTAWRPHLDGISKVIQRLRPKYFQEGPQKALLDANRHGLVLEAYCQRKRSFLQLPNWRPKSSNSAAPAKLVWGDIIDYYMRLAALSEDATRLIMQHDIDQDCAADLRQVAGQLLDDLVQAQTGNEEGSEGRLVVESDSLYYFEGEPIFKSLLQYSKPLQGVQSNMLRSLTITASEWRHKISHPDWWPGADHSAMVELPDVQHSAIDICRSLHVHFALVDGKEVAHQMFAFLICARAARKVFHRQSKEALWLSQVLNVAAERSGWELSRHLTHMFPPKWQVLTQQGVRMKPMFAQNSSSDY